MNHGQPADLPNYVIETATWRDLNALRQVEKACFPLDAWPLMDLIAILSFPNVVRLKAMAGEQMVGFVAGDLRRTDGIGWISTIGVLPTYQGRGIGKALLQACETHMKTPVIRLCVRASNEIALNMYRRTGYEQVGRWPRYYQDGETAVVMEKRKQL